MIVCLVGTDGAIALVVGLNKSETSFKFLALGID